MTERTRGTIAAILAAAMFGSAYVATAFQLRAFTPLGGALWRSVFAMVVLAVLSGSTRIRKPVSAGGSLPPPPPMAGRLLRLLVLGVLGGLVFVIGINVAVSRVGATITAFVAGLYSVVAALLAPLILRERLSRNAVAGFAVALLGTVLLADLSPSARSLGGLAAGGVAAVSYGLYLLLVRRWSAAIQVGPIGISMSVATTATVGLLIILPVDPYGAWPSAAPAGAVPATIWLVIITALGPSLLTIALRRIEASLASSLLLINPITATALAALLLHERPSPLQFLGGVLVLIGMAGATDVLGAARRRRAMAPLERELAEPGT